jgi:endonuclease-3
MSRLTAELMGRPFDRRRAKRWHAVFSAVADRLVARYGVPTLGNFDDPVEEAFFIMLSARTTDANYRRTHAALRERFPTLRELAAAPLDEIVQCIRVGGLANKRAAHARSLAAAILRLGDNPAARLRQMGGGEAFRFLSSLPGMGPKSAFCVMMYSLGHDVFPVDANVQRVAVRFRAIPAGLKHYQAQQTLPPLVPDGRSKELHIGLVVLGRQVCVPGRPRCADCPVCDECSTGRRQAKVREMGVV